MSATIDPGYGSALAPIGSVEWAKYWRLQFQGIAKDMPHAPERGKRYYELGAEHRAWTLLTDAKGNCFPDFDSFCACRQPWGLGMEPAKFRAYLSVEVGKKAADLATVSPGSQGERTDLGETSPHHAEKLKGTRDKDTRLRAILRAPEIVQQLYRDGLITQAIAAKLGPKSPTPEQAARVAEARQAIEVIDRTKTPAAFRAEVKKVVTEKLGAKTPSKLDRVRKLWAELTTEEKATFLSEIQSKE